SKTLVSTRRVYYAAAIGLICEVCDHPPIFKRVIQNYRVTNVVGVAEISELTLAHESVEGKAGEQIAVCLVKDTNCGVDSLNIVSWSNIAIGGGGMHCSPILEIQTFEVSGRRRRGRVEA